jgi:hypothetical protein
VYQTIRSMESELEKMLVILNPIAIKQQLAISKNDKENKLFGAEKGNLNLNDLVKDKKGENNDIDFFNGLIVAEGKSSASNIPNFADYKWVLQAYGTLASFCNTLSVQSA